MPRGGKRVGAGAKPKWKHGRTTTIRVPIVLTKQILEIARQIDEKGTLDSDTDSKTINLSGIVACQVDGEIAVRLEDLVKAGYKIEPSKLAELVKARMHVKVQRQEARPYGDN